MSTTTQPEWGSDLPAIVASMTLAEKASLCSGSTFWHTQPVERVNIPAVMLTDGPHGLRKQPENSDHLGLSGSIPATCFPTASALASAWDPQLLDRVGRALGVESRAEAVAVLLGPGVNIKRSPLCGRNFEYLSEDPLLSGTLGAALVEGLQSQGVGASLKHYAANNQETDRLRVSADIDERPLREIYLASFERVVRSARPWTVMCAYNRVNGVYASEDPWLLTEVLREEWGFDGLVVSDWGAVDDRVAGLAAGLDLEMPSTGGVGDAQIVAAVTDGRLAESVLDTAVTRLLTLLRQTLPAVRAGGPVDLGAHHVFAREVAAECTVLLKNAPVEGVPLLPLQVRAGERIAVLGEFARTPRYQGAGSSQVVPTQLDTALEQLRAALPDSTVDFAPAFALSPVETGASQQLCADAVRVAEGARVVLFFLGLPAEQESEGFDRDGIDLPTDQVAALAAVAQVNPRVVVVLANGGVVTVSGWQQHAAAVLEAWLGGQAAGGAIADVLLGQVNPAGRLAETIPVRLQDNPSYLNFPGEYGHVRYGEGIFVGYRGYDAIGQEVSYPFGHGLSYTTFGYDDLQVLVGGSAETGDLALTVSATITNTGQRAGAEVVQVYAGHPDAVVARPVRELVGYTKVRLEPGESRSVSLVIPARDLSYWSTRAGQFVLDAGRIDLAVGASSRDLRLQAQVETPGTAPPVQLRIDSTLHEWLQHPTGGPALSQVVGSDESSRMIGALGDEQLVKMIGAMPLRKIASFSGMGITAGQLASLEAELGIKPT